MNYSQQILGKNLDDLNLEDLQAFFSTDKIETSTLEFKSGETDINKLCKEIVGMLNCDGGLIILGAPKKSVMDKDTKFKTCKGHLTRVEKFKNYDSLIQQIKSNINEIPMGVRAHPIRLEKDDFIYVIEVPKSTVPPHQHATKGVYYIRINGESIPASHGIVESLFNRRNKPELIININASAPDFLQVQSMKNAIELNINLWNKSDETANDCHILLDFYHINSFRKPTDKLATTFMEGERFKFKHNWSTPLVDGLMMGTKLFVDSELPYLVVQVSYWCRNSKLKTHHYLFGIEDGSVVFHESIKGSGRISRDVGILTELLDKGKEIYGEE